MEKSINYALFYRTPKGVVLTNEGKKLYPHATKIVNNVKIAIEEMNNSMQEHIIIGSTDSNATTRIIPFLANLHKHYPNMSIELITGTTREITNLVLNYQVDIAFISGEPKNDALQVLSQIDETMCLVEPLKENSPNTYLSFKEGCEYKDFGKNYISEHIDKNFKIFEFGSFETILGCVELGMGKSILPLSIVEKFGYQKKVKIKKLPKENANIPTCLVCRKDNY
ncbi:LysR substrate-binding domain-containing protein [Sulfurimonas sp.]|uniref:LysR substrate-binding domain-containing protein n=1 Tax=Sulfurimonas sp. TaxID=2022749 RepID=UPI0039E40E89